MAKTKYPDTKSTYPGEINPGEINPGEINPEVINPEVINPEEINPEEINPEVINPEVINPEVINPEVINYAAEFTQRARAKKIFRDHNVDVIHFTSDGQAFIQAQHARMHAEGLKDQKITPIKREEV